MDWISVKDELPQYAAVMLVTDGERVTAADWYKEGGWGFSHEDKAVGFSPDSITHWMPLPTPPKTPQVRDEPGSAEGERSKDNDETSDTHFLAHPEVKELFSSVFSTLVEESDRGAVLVGAEHVARYLKRLFEAVAPQGISQRRLKETLGYPGALSSFSAKTEVAYLTRLISKDLYDAINHLRGLRNDLAHSPDSFRLADYEQRLRKMYELGHGVPAAINRWAGEALLHSALKNMLEIKDPISEEDKPAFASPQEALDFMSERPDLMGILEEKRLRYELALGVVMMCGLIVFHREKAKEVLGGNKVISLITRREASSPQTSDS